MNIPIFDVALPIQKILYSRNFKAANIGSILDLKHLQKKARFVKLEKLVVIRAYLGAKPVVLGQVAPVMVNSYYVNYWNLS